MIEKACLRQIARLQGSSTKTLVAAGVGRFIIKYVAQRLNVDYVDFADLIPTSIQTTLDGSDCAPAVAVAMLASGLIKDSAR